jgi:alkanesulfonate monooxygenase SsuD/methylene tetrahydromethanopterin reductase-like flavin-dependent oxidoreductase (luciferase family)
MMASTSDIHPWVAAGRDGVRFATLRFPVADRGWLRDEMQYLETAGFDAVFFPDHPMLWPDPWISLAAAADATTTLRLGSLVTCAAYRHPAVLARAVADLDGLSAGRAVLGLGSGDMPWEFDMLGLTYGSAPARRELLAQTLQIVLPLLRGDTVSTDGAGFAVRNATLPGLPVQESGVPVIVAGGSRGTLWLAAEHADALNIGPVAWAGGAYSADDATDKFTLLDQLCTDRGRSTRSVLRTGLLGLSLASTTEKAQAVIDAIQPDFRDFLRGFYFAGTPDDAVRYLDTLIASGYQYLAPVTADLFTGSRAMTDLLVREVLPRVDRTPSRIDADVVAAGAPLRP